MNPSIDRQIFVRLQSVPLQRFQRRRRPRRQRLRRLLPGLWVALVLTVLVAGPAVTKLSLAEYASDPDTWRFLLHNVVLMPVQPGLPEDF